ncbi:MAG TPA: hypothetical protein VNJ51_01175 [Candidatus Dormibacteraeota bacterium]|nr:hypothetical protein [Candidatus Dormibacteraeota bacterium]
MLQALAFAVSLLSPVLAVTPAIPPSEMGTIPDACRADYDRLVKQTEVVVAYRNSVALLTKSGVPVMPGPAQQQATDAFNAARGSIGKAAPGATQAAQEALVQVYAAADPLDDLVVQYASDLQGYVDEVASVTGAEPTRIAPPAANAPATEVEAWNVVQQDVTKLSGTVAKIDAALDAERQAQAAYVQQCRGGSSAVPAPAATAATTPPIAAAAPAAPPVATTPAVAAPAANAPAGGPQASPAAAQLRRAFATLVDWLRRYHDEHGAYPTQIDRAVLADADALNPFHTGFGYRAVRATYYLGTFTGMCACDDEIAADFAKFGDWYENAGKHAPFLAPGIWYTPSVYFR